MPLPYWPQVKSVERSVFDRPRSMTRSQAYTEANTVTNARQLGEYLHVLSAFRFSSPRVHSG